MGNSELAAHLKKSFNVTYLSPDIQNELITLTGKEILSSISSNIQDVSCFAVIADKTTNKKSVKHSYEIFERQYFDGTMYWYDRSVKLKR